MDYAKPRIFDLGGRYPGCGYAGYNCINFEEFVFLPRGGDFETSDYAAMMKDYYYFAPSHPRLMRAWKRGNELSNIQAGGHHVDGEGLRLSPIDFCLRHYIILSESYGWKKYGNRTFSDAELQRGWHLNRLTITRENLTIPSSDALKTLTFPASNSFDRTSPVVKHFWEWC